MFMNAKKAGDLILPDSHVHKLEIRGTRKNEDTWIGLA
jgi:hypothetical protein